MNITKKGETTTTQSGAILTKLDTLYTTKSEVHDQIIKQNISHFSAAENTPVGLNIALYHAIGPRGTSLFCDRVLEI